MAHTKGRAWRIPEGFERAFVEFQTIPNIGKAMAEDLVRLKVRSIRQLARKDPMRLYRGISELDGVRHDPCVLDAFLAAVEYAKTGACRPWWEYTPQRKLMLVADAPRPRAAAKKRAKRVRAK